MSSAYYSPGSSPPEIAPQAHWEDVEVEGSGPFATWTRMGSIPWQVEWQEALDYAKDLYRYVSVFQHGPTGNGSCLAAALVALYQEYDGNGDYSDVKSMVFLSTIPRGRDDDSYTVHGRLSDPSRCHPIWKANSYYWVDGPAKKRGGKPTMVEQQGPTRLHAEDVAINMMLEFRDQLETAQNAANQNLPAQDAPRPPRVQWLGDMSMLVYGVQPTQVLGPSSGKRRTWVWTITPEDQVWPCGPRATDPHNRKQPSCQEVLDRMLIKWRFGIIPSKEPTPEPELPPLPPGYPGGGGGSGSGGGGGSSGGGYHPGYASGAQQQPQQSTSSFGPNPFTSDYFAGEGTAYVRNVLACRAAAAKRGHTPVHSSRSKRSRRKADLPSRHNTHCRNTILKMLQKPVSLSSSMAKLSLGGRPVPVQRPSVRADRPRHAQPQHTDGGGVRASRRDPVHRDDPGTPRKAKKAPPADQQVPVAQTRPKRTAASAHAGQQEAPRHGGNRGSHKIVPVDGTRHYY